VDRRLRLAFQGLEDRILPMGALEYNREALGIGEKGFIRTFGTWHLRRDYPRDLTEFEVRFDNEPACRDLLVPIALAGGFSVVPSSEE